MAEWNNMAVDEYLDLKDERIKDEIIANMKGISYQTLARWKRNNNVNAYSRRTVERYTYLKEELKLNDYQIANRWKIDHQTLNYWKRVNGITNVFPKIYSNNPRKCRKHVIEYIRKLKEELQ